MTATQPIAVDATASAIKLLPPPAPADPTSRFEEMLHARLLSGERFEETVRELAESLGGAMLFHVGLCNDDGGQGVAAVALGQSEQCEIVIVDLPDVGGGARVKPASESDLPVAAIARAYAGLAECWGRAAGPH